MKYLKAEEVLVIHSEIIDATGGMHGIRDTNLFASILERPKSAFAGKDMYGGVFKKGAVYLESIIQYHVFVDGNKRTAAVSMARFLFLNGYDLVVPNKIIEDFVVKVAVEKLDIEIIAAWIKKYSKKIK